MARLLFNRNSPSILVKLYHAEWSRIFDPVAEHRCTVLLLCALTEHFTQRIAVEDVIAEHKAYRVVAHKLTANQQCVRDTAEYSRAVTPPIQQAGNRLSGLAETACPGLRKPLMRVYSRDVLSKPYTSRIDLSCSASMLVIFIR